MKQLVIWANSYCRSTLAFFQGFGNAFDAPLKVCVLKELSKARKKTGFKSNEFDNLDITFIGDNNELAYSILDRTLDAHHIFGAYQASSLYRDLIKKAKQKGCPVGICSEAPCNMTSGPSFKRAMKEIYSHTILPYICSDVCKSSDFIVNFSGDDDSGLKTVGWPASKIIPCGYYSPRIQGTRNILRNQENWNNFTILLSGIHQWHRSPMLLLEALCQLKKEGLSPKCYITQEGPLLAKMKKYAQNKGLTNVNFLGFVSMDRLKELYETCSVYVGAGNFEPWGMRLNDVLQCGAPIIVNSGMGGAKLVRDYECGLVFQQNNAMQLADSLRVLITNKNKYLKLSGNAHAAAEQIAPEIISNKIVRIIKTHFKEWA